MRFSKLFSATAAVLLAAFLSACNEKPVKPPEPVQAVSTNQQVFQVKGVIRELNADGKTAKIKHEEIPDYMPAMTMDFEVKNPKELTGIKVGDAVTFKMVVTDDDFWLEKLTKLNTAPEEMPSRSAFRVVRDVPALKEGDILPTYRFTNELGQAVSTDDWKGNAVAFTFIFTSCPIPTFCPRMSQNFADVQKKLQAMTNAPTNWHLFTISFDPEKDTPAVLSDYAKRYSHDPKRWSFLTGDMVEISAVAQQVGQLFWWEEKSINHNLRTVVLGADGKIQKIIPENKWTADELVEELVKAANAK